MVGGTSVAVFGTIWFACATLLAVAGLTGPPAVRENVSGYLFAGSTLALASVLYLGYASFVVLKLVCVLCLTTYAAVLGLFFVTGAASPVPFRSLPARAAADLRRLAARPSALALALITVAASAALLFAFPRDPGVEARQTGDPGAEERVRFEQWFAAQPRMALDVPADGAAVVVVKFNDYQCPPCRQTFADYEEVFARYDAATPGAVRLVLKDFPLETECNAGVTSSLHVAGCEAAVAVRLARERGTAEALERWLFANQEAMTPSMVEQGARDVGGVTDFRERYSATLDAVKADIEYGRMLGVRATPTFFVNGVMIQGGLPPHLFDLAIARELQKASSP
jgi:predicted DsbA family dithiol-disulfide isomerase